MPRSASRRLEELLVARATQGLDAAETAELERLLAADPDVDAGGYDRAAAAICLAVLGGSRMPGHLQARLERQLAARKR